MGAGRNEMGGGHIKKKLNANNNTRVMDVVKETFLTQFEVVKQAILSCDFVAIDTELTGLSASKQGRINSLDSAEERYVRPPPRREK
jgi:DNA polymerase III epsilon subunit-like protein